MNCRTPFSAAALLSVLLLFSGCESSKDLPAEYQRDTGTVSLSVDFGGRKSPKSIDVVCSPNSTVFLSLERAQQMDKLDFEFTGKGETVFITAIDGVKNEGAAGDNWIYRVNGNPGDRSAGVFSVKPGDRITWSLGDIPKELNGVSD